MAGEGVRGPKNGFSDRKVVCFSDSILDLRDGEVVYVRPSGMRAWKSLCELTNGEPRNMLGEG